MINLTLGHTRLSSPGLKSPTWITGLEGLGLGFGFSLFDRIWTGFLFQKELGAGAKAGRELGVKERKDWKPLVPRWISGTASA